MASFRFSRGLIFLLFCVPAAAQPLAELEAFAPRRPPDLAPSIMGRQIKVRGVVAAPRVRIQDSVLVAIQNARGAGVTVLLPRGKEAALEPGDQVEVSGEAGGRAGLPVVRASGVAVLGREAPPPPQRMKIRDAARPENLGRFVEVEGSVTALGPNAGGDVMYLSGDGTTLTVFLPRNHRAGAGLSAFGPGDYVRVRGISSQYDPIPPHDGYYQVTVREPGDVELIARSPGTVSASVLAAVLGPLLTAIALWWYRERRMSVRNRVLRGMVRLSEYVLEAPSHKDILIRLRKELPSLVSASGVSIHLLEDGDEILQPVVAGDRDASGAIPVSATLGSTSGAVALCFRNRSLLRIPDTRSSPLFDGGEPGLPRAAVCVPMFSQGEVLGVLAVEFTKPVRRANPDQDVALQHLGNQIAAVVKLNEQRQMREQLLRSEKMAAAGQLISAIATDLRAPTENIIRTSRELGGRNGNSPELEQIAREAGRALEIIDHLLSFSRTEQREARPIDLHALTSDLIEMRSEDARRKSVKFDNQLPVAPSHVVADRSQMEHALLTVIIAAEQAAVSAPDRCARVLSRVLGHRILLTFEVRRPVSQPSEPELDDYLGVPVAQAVFGAHGGEFRQLTHPSGGIRLEIELPVHEPTSGPVSPRAAEPPLRVFTCLLVESDAQAERRLLALLAARGHRAIPVARAEDAVELVQRMQFDVMFCASRLPGLNWLELLHRVRRRVGMFVLMNETRDPEGLRLLEHARGRILARPVQERELDEFLGSLQGTPAERHA